jgi:hypothetical protein
VAFNSLPAAFTPDFRGLRYLVAPNQPQSDHASKATGIQNGGDMFGMNPWSHRCCQHNSGHGWPYFCQHLWYATAGDGLAAYLYAPCTVTAKVAGGVEVKVEEQTRYPFEESITLKITPGRVVRFPLYLRIPAWCGSASIAINDMPADTKPAAGKVVKIDREWRSGDTVRLSLPMTVQLATWTRNTVSVQRGPLTYSLLIKEKYVRYGGTPAWPALDIFPDSPWNYGLDVGSAGASSLKVAKGDWPADDRPFTHACPVRITAPARRIGAWGLDARGLVREVVAGPVRSKEPVESVSLIPMGAARLRITAFPRVSNSDDAREWPPPVKPRYQASASHCWENDSTDALCDDVLPKSSADESIPRFTWWPRKGTKEWVQYDFKGPTKLSAVAVYWFDDTPRGGCKLPASWRLLYRDGKEWKPVVDTTEYLVAKDRLCEARFTPVTTTAVRLEATLQAGSSAGILEWQVKPGGK